MEVRRGLPNSRGRPHGGHQVKDPGARHRQARILDRLAVVFGAGWAKPELAVSGVVGLSCPPAVSQDGPPGPPPPLA